MYNRKAIKMYLVMLGILLFTCGSIFGRIITLAKEPQENIIQNIRLPIISHSYKEELDITKNMLHSSENKNTQQLQEIKNLKEELVKYEKFKARIITRGKKDYLITKEEIEILERIVAAEATRHDLKGKTLIANNIFNRLFSNQFPNTIKDVVFQRKQYSPVMDGRYYTVDVTDLDRQAVIDAVSGIDYSQGALFFANIELCESGQVNNGKANAQWMVNNLHKLFKYKGHTYFK